MKKAPFIVLILFFADCPVFAQPGISIQGGFQFGKMLTEKKHENQLLYTFTLDFSKQTSGEKYWQADHKFPQMGLQLTGRKFLSDQNLDLALSIIPYLEFNVLKSGFGTIQIKHGTGLAFVSGDFTDKNKSYLGSRLNAATMLDLGYQFNIGVRFNFKAGASLSHISNGNLVRPNAGVNALLPYLQLAFYPAGKLNPTIVRRSFTAFRKWHYRVQLASGFYNYQKDRNTVNTNMQASMLGVYQHTTRFRTGLGVEAGALFQNKRWQPALYAEEEVLIGHLTTRYGLGYYFSNTGEGRLYEKVGIAWYPFPLTDRSPKRLFVGMAIKAHGFQAAHIEVSTGYLF
jgi:hypothetical protein